MDRALLQEENALVAQIRAIRAGIRSGDAVRIVVSGRTIRRLEKLWNEHAADERDGRRIRSD
jgi:hypothetical protein